MLALYLVQYIFLVNLLPAAKAEPTVLFRVVAKVVPKVVVRVWATPVLLLWKVPAVEQQSRPAVPALLLQNALLPLDFSLVTDWHSFQSMFHDKKTPGLFFLFFILIFFSQKIFASSKVINSLSLGFTRTETPTDTSGNSQESVIKGKITWCKSPSLFIFEITEPVKQIMYLNSQGAFILDGDTVYEITENQEFLQQTCDDFLNWFKEDLGLRASHFTPSLTWLQNGRTLTQWDCHYKEDHPLDKVLVYTDSYGRFTELKMYMDSTVLVTQTLLSEFENSAGYSYPTLITSISYENDLTLVKTRLKLWDIKFNLPCELLSSTQKIELKVCENALTTGADLSVAKKIQSPVTPAQAVYRVSIPSVLVNTSFKFYKKFITNQDMTNCPFYPSCSQYMLEAVSKNGLPGFIQGLERLKRCTATEHKRNLYPTLSNGKHYDAVPEKGVQK